MAASEGGAISRDSSIKIIDNFFSQTHTGDERGWRYIVSGGGVISAYFVKETINNPSSRIFRKISNEITQTKF